MPLSAQRSERAKRSGDSREHVGRPELGGQAVPHAQQANGRQVLAAAAPNFFQPLLSLVDFLVITPGRAVGQACGGDGAKSAAAEEHIETCARAPSHFVRPICTALAAHAPRNPIDLRGVEINVCTFYLQA